MKFDVMDHTGHSTEAFDKANAAELVAAEARFNELVAEGRTAAVRTGKSEAKIVRKFDPAAEEVLFIPRLQGG
jgi:hypothetical protein